MSVTYNFVEPLKDPEWISGKDILPLLKDFVNPVGIEIGVDYGTTSVHLLNSLANSVLYGIDPYITYNSLAFG
mgnify:CR=1 FL=1